MSDEELEGHPESRPHHFYGYSILRGLWMLIKLDCRDERMEDALAVLRDKWTSG